MSDPLRVFVGYDSREEQQYAVCVRSLRATASEPVCIQPLSLQSLTHAGLYRRTWHYDDGQFIDNRDDKPFSTEFSFSRFLVPALCQWKGIAVFCDSDFLWRDDIYKMIKEANTSPAVSVVQHEYKPQETHKMRGQVQSRTYRKNWSSLVLWNCAHGGNRFLTPYQVNMNPGSWLHGFAWLQSDEIGELDERWNWLEGHSTGSIDPGAVHYTRGSPDMPGKENAPYAKEWWGYLGAEYAEAV